MWRKERESLKIEREQVGRKTVGKEVVFSVLDFYGRLRGGFDISLSFSSGDIQFWFISNISTVFSFSEVVSQIYCNRVLLSL